MRIMKNITLLLMGLLLTGCLGMPDSVVPVKDFKIDRYMGKWYEIARLDHSFERGLEAITANYSLRKDGGVSVENTGYSVEKKEWNTAEGKAYFVNENNEGYLKVSFFGPFYGSYVIFELDREDYDYAFVSGPDLSYLWLLSRSPDMDQGIIDRFIEKSEAIGFDTSELIFVNHDVEG